MLSCCRNLGATTFRGLLPIGRARNTDLLASRAYAVRSKYVYPNSSPNSFLILSRSSPAKECVRFKSKGKGSRRQEYESDSDDESDDDLGMYEDPQGRPTKVLHKLASLRLDYIFMKDFDLSRRKVETMFLGGHVYVNDAAVNKSTEVHVNDIVEIRHTLEGNDTVKNMPIKKIEIVKIKLDVTGKQFSIVYVILE